MRRQRDTLRRGGIDFVDYNELRGGRSRKCFYDRRLFLVVQLISSVDEQDDHVSLPDRLKCLFKHALLEQVPGHEKPRSIQEDGLDVVGRSKSCDTLPGGLSLGRDDAQLLPDELIHQRGFSSVRTPDQCDVSRTPRGGGLVCCQLFAHRGKMTQVEGLGNVQRQLSRPQRKRTSTTIPESNEDSTPARGRSAP